MATDTGAGRRASQDANVKSTPACSAVFARLYRSDEALTKQEIALACNISLPTVYQSLGILAERGLVSEGGDRRSTGGRRPQTFTINATGAAAIGISVTGSHLRAVACDLLGNRLPEYNQEVAMPSATTTAQLAFLIQELALAVEEQLRQHHIPTVGLGIAVPSAIDPGSGRLLNTSILGITDGNPLADALAPRLSYPDCVFNDADCGGYAQSFPRHSKQNLVFLSLNRGVGGAILIDGAPLPGDRGLAGELGHICIDPQGPACGCGKRGCLEAFCSSDRLSADLGCSLDEFFHAVERGDKSALETLESYIDHLSRGIQIIHMVLDCPVALGGELAQHLLPYLGDINARVGELDPFTPDASYVACALHPVNGVPLGAAQRMIQLYVDGL